VSQIGQIGTLPGPDPHSLGRIRTLVGQIGQIDQIR
jgi:hypothetical protein